VAPLRSRFSDPNGLQKLSIAKDKHLERNRRLIWKPRKTEN